MTKPFSIVASVCLIVLTGAIVCLGYNLYPHLTGALDAWANAAPNFQPTLDAISGPRGTLHEINKAVVKAGDAIVTTQIQTRKITPATLAAVNSLATIAPHANAAMDQASKTADAATQLTQGLSERVPGTIDRADALLADSSASVRDFDALLTSPDMVDSLHNANLITASWAGTSEDFHVWSHKLWNPNPCYTTRCRIGRGFKVAGGYLGLAAQAGEASTFWRALPVKVK